MSREDELKGIIEKCSRELEDIQQKTLEYELKNYVGKYYKYSDNMRNDFSLSAKDYFFIYVKEVCGEYLRVFQFRNTDSHFNIMSDVYCSSSNLIKEISKEEFDTALIAMLEGIDKDTYEHYYKFSNS